MRPLIAQSRRLVVLAVAIAAVGVALGACGWVAAYELLGLRGADLAIVVGIATAIGGVLATIFGEPLFSSGLRLLLERDSPVGRDELEAWREALQTAILRKRVQGALSQRDQMLRGSKVIDLTVTGNLSITVGRDDRIHVHPDGPRQTLSQLIEQWDESGGRLILLGDPGYGKTFAALTLIDHVNRAGRQVAELFPLVDWHNWSGGDGSRKAIEDWLVFELCQSYPELPKVAAMTMVSNGTLVPIFDGLDEMPPAARHACRDALEAFAGRAEPFRSFVVTCRQDEYLAMRPRWIEADRLHGLVGLDRDEIDSMLRVSVSDPNRWKGVFEALAVADKPLIGLLKSPLRLGAAIDAYGRRDPAGLLNLARSEDPGAELWDLLLRMDRQTFPDAQGEDVRRWLGFLAASLRSHGRQRFWLHELYLYVSPRERRRFHQISYAIFAVTLAIPWLLGPRPLKFLGVFVLVLGAIGYRVERDRPIRHTVRRRASISAYVRAIPRAIVSGLVSGAVWVACLGTLSIAALAIASTLEGWGGDVGQAVIFSIQVAGQSWIIVAGFASVITLIEVGATAVAEEPPKHMVGRGPGAVIRGSLVHAVISAVAAGVLVGIPFSLIVSGRAWVGPPIVLMLMGVVAWLEGLEAWLFYHWTRLRLARAGLLPRRLRRFLDWVADDTGWLRASDAYEFRHRELLDFLAKSGEAVGAQNLSWTESLLARARYRPSVLKEVRRRSRSVPAGTEPIDATSFAAASIACSEAGDLNAALEHARRAMEITPDEGVLRYNLAVCLTELGRDEEALDVLDAVTRSGMGESRDFRSLRREIAAIVKSEKKELTKARLEAEKVPANALAHWLLAVCLRAQGRGREAEDARCQALEFVEEGADQSFDFVWGLNERGYSESAIKVADAMASIDQEHEMLTAKAHAYADLGRDREAETCIALAEQISETPVHYNSLANALLAAGRFAEATNAVERAIGGRPGDSVFAFTWAEVQLAAEDFDSTRRGLSDAFGLTRRRSGFPGDPTWLCRILWSYVDLAALPAGIEVVFDAYKTRGTLGLLSWGLVQGTPTSPAQTRWDPERLDAWCAAWARCDLRRAVGIIRALSERDEEGRSPTLEVSSA